MAKTLTRSAVRVYGALSGLGNGDGSVLGGLLPFFDPILRRHNGAKFDPDAIAADVRETYKWNFTADVVEAFIEKFVAAGWVSADVPGAKDSTYTISLENNDPPDAISEKVEVELRSLAVKFKAFAVELSPLTAVPRDVEEFEDIIVEWLLYSEMFNEKSLEAKPATKMDPSGTIRRVTEVPNITSLRDEDKYLCARFVKEALEKDNAAAETLTRIAAVGLLTEVVQDFVKPVTHIDRSDLVVYLDAPMAMELLGVSGRSSKENIRPLVSELVRIGASVRVYGQSIEEIKRSLQTFLTNARPFGPTADAIRRGEVLREYVSSVAVDPAAFLSELGVTVA